MITSKTLEYFLHEHISAEDPLLEDLYRQTHIRFLNPNMLSGHLQGKFLEMISMMIKPETILEIGTFTGYSAICLAKGLQPSGKLITIEQNDELTSFSKSYFIKSGLYSQITQLTGNALEIIPGLEMMFDLVFIDGDKREYCDYYKTVIDKVKPGGFILADNVYWGGKAMEKESKDPQANGIIKFNNMIMKETMIEHLIVPIRDGLTIIRKKTYISGTVFAL